MRTLTEYQKNFILNKFFKDEQYAGWKNIATKLLETGSCVVPGNKCIWHGGIGNFIKTSQAEGYFGCCLYEFNIESFLSSKWYVEICDEYTNTLSVKMSELKKEYNELRECSIRYLKN